MTGEPESPSRRRLLRVAAGSAAASLAGVALVARGNRLDAHRSSGPVPAPASGRLPLRLAVLTDVHAPHFWFAFDALAAAVRDFDPDLVFVVGDALNRRGDEPLVRAYAELPARAGKFAALGNWEYQGPCDLERLRAEYDRAGVRLLLNETADVDHGGEPLRIVGLDDMLRGRPDFSLVAGAPRAASAPRTLILGHCPGLFDAVGRSTAAPLSMFAGHTHGGQIAPFGRALITPPGSGRYVKGWYARGGQHLYVSRGLGNSDVPFRVGSPPELALLTI